MSGGFACGGEGVRYFKLRRTAARSGRVSHTYYATGSLTAHVTRVFYPFTRRERTDVFKRAYLLDYIERQIERHSGEPLLQPRWSEIYPPKLRLPPCL